MKPRGRYRIEDWAGRLLAAILIPPPTNVLEATRHGDQLAILVGQLTPSESI